MADYEDTKVTDLIINNMSQEKFDELKAAGELDPTQIYCTPEEGGGGASLPDQTDNAGKFLTTDGTTASWGNAIKNGGDSVTGTYVFSKIKMEVEEKVTSGGIVFKTATHGLKICGLQGHIVGLNLYGNIIYNLKALYASDNTTSGRLVVPTEGGTLARIEDIQEIVAVLPTADNGYTTVKNFGNGYVEITGYTAIGTVGAGTGSEVQIDLPAGYTMADANYWVNIAPTSETTMFDFKAEAKARSTTHFMVAYKNEDTTTGLTAAGVYWEVRGMLATE